MSRKIAHLVLVTGLSGAGKSCTLKYLENIGFYWTDNLPLPLIPTFLNHFNSGTREEYAESGSPTARIAIGLHLRDPCCMTSFRSCYQKLLEMAEKVELLFIEANLETLIRRYQETRSRHPLAKDLTVQEAIYLEAQSLEPIRAMADLIIETSKMTVPELKDRLEQLFKDTITTSEKDSDLIIFIRSFGFKYGVNTDADMVLDGRFLPNPHYDPVLRPFTGRDEPIIHFLEKDGEALDFLNRLQTLFDYLLPRYRREKKRYFTIDIGCTGGHHRSVFLVEQLSRRLIQQGFRVLMRHRDINRATPRLENE